MNLFKVNSRLIVSALSLITAFLISPAYSDDTEIFFSESKTSVNPNVMFVIDVSGSMKAEVSGSGGKNRLQVMQDALRTVLSTAPDNLNVGLMNYGEVKWREKAHGVKFPVTDITALAEPVVSEKIVAHDWGKDWWESSIPEPEATITVRDYLSKITDWYWKDNWYRVAYGGQEAKDMEKVGVTPIVEALYEAALYFRGEKVSYGLGDVGNWNRWSAHQSTYEGDPVKWDSDICKTTKTNTTGAPINFEEGEYPWYKCPADPSNPTSPGTYENCKATENCTTTTNSQCKNYVSGYCSEKVIDEGGVSRCAPDSPWVSGYCENDEYEDETKTRCTYQRCAGGHTSEPNYRTPITQTCQSNFIVLLSDGKPQYSGGYDTSGNRDGTNTPGPTYWRLKDGRFAPMVDKVDASNQFDHTDCEANKTPSGYPSGTCGPELTSFLSKADNSDLEGVQTINTYAIGFGLGGEEASAQDYLKSLVSTDDPATPEVEGYFSAEDEVQLSQAFSHILAKISSTTTSFASPGYSVDLKTSLFNEDDIYIPVFDKGLTPRWSGNLKKFKLQTDSAGKNFVADKNGLPAVDNLGVFSEDATDVWSTSSTGDGREVAKGGVAQLIDPNNRLAVTDLGCTSYPCKLMENGVITNTKNRIHPENDESNDGVINNAVLGLADDVVESTRINMLNFIRGRKWNEATGVFDTQPHMGDMLHTEPLIVTYREDYKSDGEPNGQVIYASTNEGYLHAFDTVTGKEIFAFMPSSLMKNIPAQYYNSTIGKHAYGIDGIMSKRTFTDEEGVKRTVLYFGLRRGGREYYALDVTVATAPKLLWKVGANAQQALDTALSPDNQRCENNAEIKSKCTIDGVLGVGDFARLGQSWSTPYLAKIRSSAGDSSAFKDVVIFSGGYDTNQDEEDQEVREATDTVGNEVFIVDAFNGTLLWSAHGGGSLGDGVSNASQLTHSIPGGMRILDMNRDGAVDRMYFADTKGDVWRLELPTGPSFDLSDSKLIKFASLGGTAAQNRMFFNEPDVALLKKGGRQWLTVSLGSGYRAHPANDEASDRFYVLIDGAVNTPLEKNNAGDGDFETLDHSDLVAITVTGDQTISSIYRGAIDSNTILDVEGKAGWYMNMPKTGEKVLATSITSEGNVMFTTLVPDVGAAASTVDLCSAPITQGRFYSFNILTAKAGSDLNRSGGTITDSDLMAVVTANEIPGKPQRVFNKPTCEDKECTQMVDIRVGKRNEALTTYDASLLESVFWTNPERK